MCREYAPDPDGETIEVNKEALDGVLEYCLATVNFAKPDDEPKGIPESVRQLYADRYDTEICGLCVLPHGAGYRAKPSGFPVCGTHADALEAGDWSGMAQEIEPLEESDDDDEALEQRDVSDVVWLGFSNSPSHSGSVVRGPFSNEQAAVESVAEFESFHVEPRRVQDDESEECVARDVHPTY